MKRKIITIDEKLCNGCGECIPGCPEQAIQVVETKKGPKARLVKDFYCDGLGACLGTCPTGALQIEEKEAAAYDDKATVERIKKVAPEMLETHAKHMKEHGMGGHSSHQACACPSSQTMDFRQEKHADTGVRAQDVPSELTQWPVQMHLVLPSAPYFKNADLLVAADCVPFTYANFHGEYLKGRALVIGCPKLDDVEAYIEKMAAIISEAGLKSIKIVRMEVPCCAGLEYIVKEAMKKAGKNVPVSNVVIGIKGSIITK
ncbi:MAG: hypothetical protein A2297_07215 [Elusimicrobia bacterium RIFOXYB2_FULL_48_7]|nr:MAG: hypothetical protein A2297_07215 [Elusimicrobia bacterium RIFOXYB2_FULL_48_7]